MSEDTSPDGSTTTSVGLDWRMTGPGSADLALTLPFNEVVEIHQGFESPRLHPQARRSKRPSHGITPPARAFFVFTV
jgi:hypothetical protein